jgi:D-galactose 1-dehydrogenase
MRPLRIGIVGFGDIAAEQHVPAIAAHPRLELGASVSRSGNGPAPHFASCRELLDSGIALDAVAVTTPPGPRFEIARDCLQAGLHVLLEKPPAATVTEAEELACLAEARGLTLFATWHAQHNAAVARAAEALAGRRVEAMRIHWHEDVRKWHPGQRWIWEAGGFGVFDPGINALSIAARLFPGTLFVRSGTLFFPAGSATPIAAELELASDAADGPLHCSFDWRREEGEEWSIRLQATGLSVDLLDGGKTLFLNGEQQDCAGDDEYPDIYAQFVQLIDERRSAVDLRPLKLVADALLVSGRKDVPAFG